MSKRRIIRSEIVIGEPLSWDVFDQGDKLLLKRGFIVSSDKQIEALLDRGLFVDAKAAGQPPSTKAVTQPKEAPSAARLIQAAQTRLEKILVDPKAVTGFPEQVYDIVNLLEGAIHISENVAIGSVTLTNTGRYSIKHSIDAAIFAIVFGKSLNLESAMIRSLGAAALTMNISMLELQDQLQSKKEPPDDDEKRHIKSHPVESVTFLQELGVTDGNWLSIVLNHHENEDGSGYPNGRLGTDIPEEAKILAIVDRYAARVSAREYRKPQLPNAAFRGIITDDKNSLFPDLAAKFIRYMGIYPPGTYVKLASGELGIVVDRGSSSTTPVVSATISPRGEAYSALLQRDTARPAYRIESVIDVKTADFHVSMQRLWGDQAAP